ncbi:MAG: DUF2147 domain-containing protein [Candidatus Cloacimonetes bacterium HGW-Cloacimonetes-1]|jgi:uncharacterized protein (DUF2147 family)|nr:MAG: DUF2147 domain-containing protein [Candidatus Cloacimonetes bacterium HGW-Cloacimonetes-1]
MNRLILLIVVIAMLLPIALIAQKASPADAIQGVWFNAEKTSKIEIYKTKAGDFAGHIVWLKELNDENNNPKTDPLNPDPKLRSRARMGMVVLVSLDYKSPGKWDDGKIYDPMSGKTYSCKATLKNNNTLELRGFIGVPALGKTAVWERTTK